MSVLIVIPARLGSTRLPEKPLRLLHGKPLVLHAWEAACLARVGRVVVATDDERVAVVVRRAGGEAQPTDPSHASGTDRVAEVAGRSKEEVVINLQGDEAAMEPELIAKLADAVRPGAGIVTPAARLHDVALFHDRGVVKVVCDPAGRALYFSRAPIPATHASATSNGAFLAHLGMYAFDRETLLRFVSLPPGLLERREGLEQLRALENGIPIQVIETPHFSRGIDTEEDLARAEAT